MVSGSIIFREQMADVDLKEGHKLMMIVGVVQVPEDLVETECQYAIRSDDLNIAFAGDKAHLLQLGLNPIKDFSEHPFSRGTMDDYLLSPIWRV